jgi:SRSO17 transposase
VWTTKDREVAAAAMVEAAAAEENLGVLVGRFGPFFARVEPLRQAGKYVRGLMSDLPRKNCWTLAECAGDRTPDRMQRLLERASWNTFAAMEAVRDFVVEHLAGDDGLTVLVLDESGDEKTGTHTAGVKRQYVGCAGKVANAVNFVNATYSAPRGHALVGSRLYVPAEHLADERTRTQTGIPADLVFKTKPELGLELLGEHVAARIAVPWCTADAVYGRDRKLRGFCEGNGIGYVFGVPCSFTVTLNSRTTIRVDATLNLLDRRSWQVASCGPGSKGERRYAWAWLSTTSPRHFLLIRRSLTKPAEMAERVTAPPSPHPAALDAARGAVGG